MKKIVIVTALIMASAFMALAQTDEQVERPVKNTSTLFGDNAKVRGFGALDFKVSEFKDDLAILAGVHGGIIINDHFMIGLGGKGIATNISFDGINPANKLHMYGGYGGLMIGGIFAPKKAIHISVPILIGAGGAEVTDQNYFGTYSESNGFYETSAFFIVEPGMEVEINLTKFFRIGLGVSYRMISGSEFINIKDKELSGFSSGISLKFGGF